MTQLLGIRVNAAQFWLLVAINALVGSMVGIERSTLSLMGKDVFSVDSAAALTAFLVAFGLVKALANLAAGVLSDRWDRRRTLMLGWTLALPVPLLIGLAPSWGWVIAANALLGASQGLAWSSTVIMKIDLVGPARRGLAMGLNEAAGYGAAAVAALAAALVADALGLRESVVILGAAIAIVGFLASAFFVRDTTAHAEVEQRLHHADVGEAPRDILRRASWSDPTIATASHVGLVNNVNDGMAWALLPVWFATHGASTAQIGALAATYPFVWGTGQLAAGWASDHVDRRLMIGAGMLLQAASIGLLAASSIAYWVVALVGLGLGTAMVYPTLLAVVSDAAAPSWRARAVGVYRMWRDLGYVVGALLCGLVADLTNARTAILLVAGLTAAAGVLALARMRPRHYTQAVTPSRQGSIT